MIDLKKLTEEFYKLGDFYPEEKEYILTTLQKVRDDTLQTLIDEAEKVDKDLITLELVRSLKSKQSDNND